jgi:hypothetical protein
MFLRQELLQNLRTETRKMAEPFEHTINLKEDNVENIFDEAIKYFTTQNYSLINQVRPTMLVFERGTPYRWVLEKAYTKLTIAIGWEKDNITIRFEFHLPYHTILVGDKNNLIKEAERFHKPEQQSEKEKIIYCPHCGKPLPK